MKRTAYSLLGFFVSALASNIAMAQDFAKLELYDAATGKLLASPAAGSTTHYMGGNSLLLRVSPAAAGTVGRVRVSISDSTPGCSFESNNKRSLDDTSAPFEFRLNSTKGCEFSVVGWNSSSRWDGWLGQLSNVAVEPHAHHMPTTPEPTPSNSESMPAKKYQITVGTDGMTEMSMGAKGERSAHGVRVYCPVSHFSYDDPIVFPGKPGAAHLHQFMGRIDVDAHTTPSKLEKPGKTSCEGGLNVASSYWQPAFFNQNGEVQLPQSVVIYYKTFMVGKTPDVLPEGIINPIPNGLEMLASQDTLNGKPLEVRNSDGQVRMLMKFPQCVAVDRNGDPVLSHRAMPGEAAKRVNSHVAYQNNRADNGNHCPSSHPYRIPQMEIIAEYDVPYNSNWYLASDIDRSRPGHSLHADYIAMWDEETMRRIVQCNRESRSCEFKGRRQLPERFLSPEGYDVYRGSINLAPGIDVTPFGRTLTPMQPGSTMKM